jgi:tetratricopeptide (TPR) repeat protein
MQEGPAWAVRKGALMPDRPESDLEDVFRDFRDEVSRDSEATETERRFKLGLTYRDMGMAEDAIRELGWAARSPRRRFEAASLVARLQRDRGDLGAAVEWFERAAEAPAPSADAGRDLLFDLAQTLERAGESARALAVYLEIRTDAGDYRDVSARIERLSRLQSGR